MTGGASRRDLHELGPTLASVARHIEQARDGGNVAAVAALDGLPEHVRDDAGSVRRGRLERAPRAAR